MAAKIELGLAFLSVLTGGNLLRPKGITVLVLFLEVQAIFGAFSKVLSKKGGVPGPRVIAVLISRIISFSSWFWAISNKFFVDFVVFRGSLSVTSTYIDEINKFNKQIVDGR